MNSCDPHDEHCITCGDEGIPMRIGELLDDGTATCVDDSGQLTTVSIELLEEVAVGDEILVHAGFAIAHLGAAA